MILPALLGAIVACTPPVDPAQDPAPADAAPADGGLDEGGAPGEVIPASCPMPVAEVAPPQRVLVSPTGGCEGATFLFPFLRVRDDDGRDVFPGATTAGSLSVETTTTACRFHVEVRGLVPPDKPDGEATAPVGVDVAARLCDARWQIDLPLTDLEAPLLEDVFFVGEGGSHVVVPGTWSLAVGPAPAVPGCRPDLATVDVDGFTLGLGFTLEVPLATLQRTSSRAVGGEAVVAFDIRPRG